MKSEPKPRCPFVENPSEECYVARMNSGAVEKTIRYCRGIYEKCEIYLGRMRQGDTAVIDKKSTTTTERTSQPVQRTDKEGR